MWDDVDVWTETEPDEAPDGEGEETMAGVCTCCGCAAYVYRVGEWAGCCRECSGMLEEAVDDL